MKGVFIALVVFGGYVLVTMLLAHALRPRRYFIFFFLTGLAFGLLYFLLHKLTPPNAFILPATWISDKHGLDLTVGFFVFLLNWHSYIDFFYGVNGGFSTSLLLEIQRTQGRGASTEELLQQYFRADGTDKIYGARLPALEQSGYLRLDQPAGLYQLTPKGLVVARLTWLLKRLLNLGAGG
ncbi:MAG: hypothetical protein HYV35_12965 [Lentisphaerae bacterium]|nr:hypothetical protein [Lentisphaerota bacterium]